MSHIKIDVPAALCNQIFGLGSSAIALGLYNSYEIEESPSGLSIDISGFGGEYLSKTGNNTIVEVLRGIGSGIGKGISGLNIRIKNDIPQGVGLGSSATSALAGVLSANSIFELSLSRSEVFGKTTYFEANTAAIAACLFGGMSIVAHVDSQPIVKSLSVPQMTVCLAAPILESPEAIPETSIGYAPATDRRLIGLNALLMDAFRSCDYSLMRRLMTAITPTLLTPSLQKWFPSAASSALNEGAAFVMPCSFGPAVSAFTENNHEAVCGALVKSLMASYESDVQSWIIPTNLHGISLSEVKSISQSDTYSDSVVMSEQDQ